MYIYLLLLVIVNVVVGQSPGPTIERVVLYQDCGIFNQPHVYGGILCGSDGVTYANSLYLDCLNHKNYKHVATMHSGACLPSEQYCQTNLYYEPVCGSDNKTYSNINSLICNNLRHGSNVTVKYKGTCEPVNPCHRYGLESYGLGSVCANNGFTYQNAAQVKCLQQYNSDLKILHDGGCKVSYVDSVYGKSQQLCKIARTRYEWNPVCSADGNTYPNPFVFLCFKPYAGILTQAECGTQMYDFCARAKMYLNTTINGGYEAETAMCGSDGKTYPTIDHLQCRSRSDKYLFSKHSGSCSGPDDNPCGAIPDETHRATVCGSDGISYVSPEALWCEALRSPSKMLTYAYDGPC